METLARGTGKAVARYAERFYAVLDDRHHVASPLGAWLLLAMVGPAAGGKAREDLSEVLGLEVDRAAAAAATLLGSPHPQVASAVAVWNRPQLATEQLAVWLGRLPTAVKRGDVPSQAAANAWAKQRTSGLLQQFPLIGAETVLLLASVLATRVAWQTAFELTPAADLGAESAWSQSLSQALRVPDGKGHRLFITDTRQAGLVGGHSALADGGLEITSVIGAPGVPARSVLAAAHDLAVPDDDGLERVEQSSLFDLPTGPGHSWTISEKSSMTTALDGRGEAWEAVLPAWSASDNHDLSLQPELGFGSASAALAALLPPEHRGHAFDARQSVMARYTREGFEAAAVSSLDLRLGSLGPRLGLIRTAELRFGHPFAVVATAVDEGPWQGIPVFSAWVAEPEDATGRADRPVADAFGQGR